MTSTDVEVLPANAQRAIVWWRSNPMLPASYRRRDGTVDVEGMERAARVLLRLEMDPYDALGDTFVIKDQVGFKADLQRHLLTRVPGYDFEILEADDEHVTARVKTKGEWKPPLTKRITDTDIQVYANRTSPDDNSGPAPTGSQLKNRNYREKPRRMLEARVSTELIDMYAKGVLRGWLMPMGITLAEDGDGPAQLGGEVSGPPPQLPPRSVAPDGTTIPEHLREPEVDEAMRQMLADRVAALDPAARQALSDVWMGELRCPNPKTHRFTRAHGALLLRMLNELSAPVSPPPPQATTGAEPRVVDTETGEVIPPHVHDDAPEARGMDEGAQPASYAPPEPVYTPEEEEPF